MENTLRLGATCAEIVEKRPFMLDTTFVLFFLAVDFGQSVSAIGIDSVFSAITLLMLLVLPYFLPFSGERPEFSSWLIGRIFIATFAVILGMMFRQTLGSVFPETFSYLPMTLLIFSAIVSCYVQFYGILKVRLAR